MINEIINKLNYIIRKYKIKIIMKNPMTYNILYLIHKKVIYK